VIVDELVKWAQMSGAQRRKVAADHVRYLETTLIPDLRASGCDAMADDLELCVRIIRAYRGGDL
jgi:hypothetical protein